VVEVDIALRLTVSRPVCIGVEVQVTLRLTVSLLVRLGIEHPCGTCNQILLPVGMLLSETAVLYANVNYLPLPIVTCRTKHYSINADEDSPSGHLRDSAVFWVGSSTRFTSQKEHCYRDF
jgi:hypothetical protein